MLVLFDIDGTLVSVKGAGRRALNFAIEQVTGVANALEGVRLHGGTDPVILQEASQRHLEGPLSAAQVEQVFDLYLERLRNELQGSDEHYDVLPGVMALVKALVETGRHVVGLATGNIEAAAQLKLQPAGLDQYFEFGGFGSDAGHRPDLVRVGIERGQSRAQARWGRSFAPNEIVVIGDTERDVSAAHEAGAKAMGVLAGSGFQQALRDAEPDILADSLEDPAVWRYLGL